MKKNKPQLTISLLISNRIETIPRCLDSLRPIMDVIPCELILIDTSRNPKVHDLLLKYTSQVFEFTWCNDFSKARNEGLKRAHGEWFMFLDDDEWFVDTESIVAFFKTGEYRSYGYADYQVRNFKDKEYQYYEDCRLDRLFRIEPDTKFVRKIHEQFYPVRGARKELSSLAYHSGYIYESPEERKKHFERNRKLLRDMIKEEPNNIYWLLQLAQEYSYAGEHEKLVAHCKECLEKIKEIDDAYVNMQRGTFYTGMVTGYLRLHQYEKSIACAKEALRDKRTGKVLEAMMRLRIAEGLLALGLYQDAFKEVQAYFEQLRSLPMSEATITDEQEVFLAGEAFSKNSQEIAYAILICSQLEDGKVDALIEHYDKLGWEQSVVYTMEGIEKYFVNMMCTMPYHTIFSQVMMDVLEKANLREAFCKEILDRTGLEEDTFGEFIYLLAYSRKMIMDGPKNENLIQYVESLQNYVQLMSQWCDFIESQADAGLKFKGTPSYLQAAISISEFLELESKEKVQALRKLKKAVEVLTEFAEGVGAFLDNYSELENQRVEKHQAEMEELRVQVIAQVKNMLAAGQTEAAGQIIGQLKQMFPGDLEVATLALEVRINS